MILLLYGTKEARELLSLLRQNGYDVLVVAATEYGSLLAGREGAAEVVIASPEGGGLDGLLTEKSVRLVVDATHSLSDWLSASFQDLCIKTNLPYIRFERKESDLPEHPLVHAVESWGEAAKKAAEFGNTVFLTTGSNNLELFLRDPALAGKRVVVRVLPESVVIRKCQDLGISPRDIVGLHGPFSTRFNRAIFHAYKADVIVTRDSGRSGGTDTKVAAALALKIPVVVVRRAAREGSGRVYNYRQVLDFVGKIGPLQEGVAHCSRPPQ